MSAPQKNAQNRPLGNYRVCPNSGNFDILRCPICIKLPKIDEPLNPSKG
jgi:predicted RNA-binding Zn-ribbon protein involved in translation (DUF1610 family)